MDIGFHIAAIEALIRDRACQNVDRAHMAACLGLRGLLAFEGSFL